MDSRTLAGRYELREELGRGGMGVIYRAYDPVLDRPVAVKMIPGTDEDPVHEKRLEREARLVARLDHPAVVPIYDFGRQHDALFFVMPLVEGTSLQVLLRERSLSLGEILELVAQAAEALDYIHRQGLVHRDVKPENLMINREAGSALGAELRLRLMDFGLALGPATKRLSAPDALPGTLAYLSPEQVLSQPLDGRCDLYSLGVVLYEALAGEAPFLGTTASVLYRIVHEEAEPLAQRCEIEPELEEWVQRCLAKDPAGRPSRGRELAVGLRRYSRALGEPEHSPAVLLPALGRAPHPPQRLPFIGRRREIDALQRRLQAAIQGECQLVLISGEIGMGKTRLLGEVENLAQTRGVRTLRGRCAAQEETLPYQGFCELLQDAFETEEASQIAARLDELAADLVEIFPMLGEIDALRAAAAERPAAWLRRRSRRRSRDQDRRQVFELLANALVRVADGEPLVLLLENLHQEASSCEALHYITRRLGPKPLLIAATFSREEIGDQHSLLELVRLAAEDQRWLAIDLEPLSPDAHAQLVVALLERKVGEGPLRAMLSDSLAQELYQATEGNPFFTQEILDSMIEAGGLTWNEAGVWALSEGVSQAHEALPQTVQQVILARLARLPESSIEVLTSAAVIGRVFDLPGLRTLLDGELEPQVEALLRGGWFEEEAERHSTRLSFASGMVREALYETLARGHRQSLHRRYAEGLEHRHGEHLESVYPLLVHHFSAAGAIDRALDYALRSARLSLAAFSTEEAIKAASQALELAAAQGPRSPRRQGEILWILARAHRAAGDLESALLHASQGVQAFEEAGEVGRAAEVAVVAVESAWQGRRIDATRLWVRKGIELARRADHQTALRQLLILAATVANLYGDSARARHYWEEVERLSPASAEAEKTMPRGGCLVSLLPQPVTVLDPAVFATSEEYEVLGSLFEPLLRTMEAGRPVPHLATSWEASDDSRTFTLKLRRDVRFSNGEPLDAEHARRSLERAARRAGERLPEALATVVGVRRYLAGESDRIEGIEVRGERLIAFRLRERLPIYPIFLTDQRTAMVDQDAAGKLHGTGPFRLLAASPERLVLERHRDHWQAGLPYLDRLEFCVGWSAEKTAEGLRSGELDLGRYLLDRELEAMLRENLFRTRWVEATKNNVHFIVWNGEGPLCRREEVRRALCGVVSAHHLIWRTLGRLAEPATSWLPPGVLGHDPARRHRSLSIEQARALITSTAPASPLRLRAAVHPVYRERYGALFGAILELWSALGVEVEVLTPDFETFRACYQHNAEVDVLFGRWFFDYDDPDNFTRGMFHSRHGLLAAYLVSDAADHALERARRESDPLKRQRLYQQAEALLAGQDQLLPLFHDVDCRIAGSRLRGVRLLAQAPFVDYARCGKTSAGGEAGRERVRSGTLRAPLTEAVSDLDPLNANLLQLAEVVPNVFETLTRIDQGARVVPHLAARVQSEAGGTRYRCRLRREVRFHDGRRFSARDVRFSFERLMRSEAGLMFPALLAIRGSQAFRDGEVKELVGLEIASSHEVVFTLSRPVPSFPAVLSQPTTAIVPEGLERCDGSWREGCAGTGPFRLLRIDDTVELAAFPQYWRPGLPRCERLVFEKVASSPEMVEGFLTGRFALAAYLRSADSDRIQSRAEYSSGYREAPGLSTYFLAFTSCRGLFSDAPARRALVRELDLQRLIAPVLGRHEIPAVGLLPPGLHSLEKEPYDLEREEARRSFAGVTIRIAVHPCYERLFPALWAEVRGAFDRLGADLRLVRVTIEDLLAGVQDVDLIASRRFAGYPDADAFASAFSSEVFSASLFLSSSELDDLISRGRSESDPDLRHAIYSEIERYLAREAFLIPLFHEQIYRFARPEVRHLRLRFGWPTVAYEELAVVP